MALVLFNDLPKRMQAKVVIVVQDPRVAKYLREVLQRGMNTYDKQNEPPGEDVRQLIEALK